MTSQFLNNIPIQDLPSGVAPGINPEETISVNVVVTVT